MRVLARTTCTNTHRRGLKARAPEQLAATLVLLMDGAYTAARVFGPARDSPAAHVAAAAQQAVAAQCGAAG